jgi:Ca2+-binding RTX toxin-like protein
MQSFSVVQQNYSLVFIDTALEDYAALAAGVSPDVEVVVLDPEADGIAQISHVLADRTHLSAVHIVSHGRPGSLSLGNTTLTLQTLKQYWNQIQQWQQSFTQDATVLLYGCEVAANTIGRSLIQQLHQLTGAAIAASTTLVGNVVKGGNWTLDFTVGNISTSLAFRAETLAAYPGILQNANVLLSEDFSDAEGNTPPEEWTVEVLEGNPETDVWRFDNPGDRSEYQDTLDDPVAIYDSDILSDDDVSENVTFESPVFNASSAEGVFLQFDQVYGGIGGGENASQIFVEASADGESWETVYSSNEDGFLVNTPTVDLTNVLAGQENAQVRFRFDGNWSYYWAIDNIEIVDNLPPGVTPPSGEVGVSESNVPDPLDLQFALQSRPTSNVTLNFTVDGSQLQPIESITFSPDNWFVPQTSVVRAIADDIAEGENQTSNINVTVTSNDPNYNGLQVEDIPVQITDSTIPGYNSYRTVEETYSDLSQLAEANSNLASWVDIGDTYDKTAPGGAPGYDIFSLELGNKNTENNGEKPVLFVQGAIHAREYVTTEIATRFAEKLVAGYGVDPESTWLLDNVDIRVVPIVNPDGRKFAEQGYSWRKNTNPGEGEESVEFPLYGVDLNRNYASKWGEIEGGASTDPADLTYQGSDPFSEPESQALRDYLLQTFPDQKPEDEFAPAPNDATGVYLDLHSFGNLVLYPFGWTNEPAPNREGLRNLGLKFGYFTGVDGEAYDVQQAIGLYPTSGTTEDWVYTTLGTAAYTIEFGTQFFEENEYFEETIVPEFTPALFYAAKSAYRPYQTSAGPDSLNVELNQAQVVSRTVESVVLTATANDTRYDDDNGNSPPEVTEGRDLPEAANIAGGRYSIDAPSWIEGTQTFEMTAADGNFDRPVEELTATIDIRGLESGRHTIFVESVDANGDYGVPTAVFLDVLDAPEAANVINGNRGGNQLLGTEETDIIYGFSGRDTIAGGSGDDYIFGGEVADTLRGDQNSNGAGGAAGGNDIIYGGGGNDNISGKGGNDKLYGDQGDDSLSGDDGDDLLWGGRGNDTLRGGNGIDTFVLAVGEGIDTIRDFRIDRDLLGLAGNLSLGQLTISQEGQNTQIAFNREVLAVLEGVQANELNDETFTPAIA